MTFAFPAYHRETYTHPEPADMRSSVSQAIARLGWVLRNQSDQHLTVSNRTTLRSWGEKITIRFISDQSIEITSQCALPTQCFDWGKNKANVKTLLTILEQTTADQT